MRNVTICHDLFYSVREWGRKAEKIKWEKNKNHHWPIYIYIFGEYYFESRIYLRHTRLVLITNKHVTVIQMGASHFVDISSSHGHIPHLCQFVLCWSAAQYLWTQKKSKQLEQRCINFTEPFIRGKCGITWLSQREWKTWACPCLLHGPTGRPCAQGMPPGRTQDSWAHSSHVA